MKVDETPELRGVVQWVRHQHLHNSKLEAVAAGIVKSTDMKFDFGYLTIKRLVERKNLKKVLGAQARGLLQTPPPPTTTTT